MSSKSPQVGVYCFQQQQIRACGVLCLPSKEIFLKLVEREIFFLAYPVVVTFAKKGVKIVYQDFFLLRQDYYPQEHQQYSAAIVSTCSKVVIKKIFILMDDLFVVRHCSVGITHKQF